MSITAIVNFGKAVCRLCGRTPRPGEGTCGPDMWHFWEPVCKHETFWTCPDCPWHGAVRCSTCSCGSFYT